MTAAPDDSRPSLRHKAHRKRLLLVTAWLGVCGAALLVIRAQVVAETLPTELSDRAFWQMVVEFSEPGGIFRSDNFVSNERTYQEVIPELKTRAQSNGVYVGVGPDQNFTYIAALRPRMAFIVDIRRQNLMQHLLYKALIELSDNRGDFLARLFSRPRPGGVDDSSSARELFDVFENVEASESFFQQNVQAVEEQLVERHGFSLTASDHRSLEYFYRAFYAEGPNLRYSFPRVRGGDVFPTYAELLMATDTAGVNHSYIANEENFQVLRNLQRRNLVVPVVGDFAGDKAVRAVGRYVTDHQAIVNYFYTSNVEQYLFQTDAFRRYYANVAALPLGENSTFIRAYFNAGFIYPPGIITPDLHSIQLLDPIQGLLRAFDAGEIRSYADVVGRSR